MFYDNHNEFGADGSLLTGSVGWVNTAASRDRTHNNEESQLDFQPGVEPPMAMARSADPGLTQRAIDPTKGHQIALGL